MNVQRKLLIGQWGAVDPEAGVAPHTELTFLMKLIPILPIPRIRLGSAVLVPRTTSDRGDPPLFVEFFCVMSYVSCPSGDFLRTNDYATSKAPSGFVDVGL